MDLNDVVNQMNQNHTKVIEELGEVKSDIKEIKAQEHPAESCRRYVGKELKEKTKGGWIKPAVIVTILIAMVGGLLAYHNRDIDRLDEDINCHENRIDNLEKNLITVE